MNEEHTRAVGMIPSGLFVITTNLEGKQEAFLGSWIQQASFTPLMISMAVQSGRPCYDAIQGDGRFVINVVGKENGGILKHFWSGYDKNHSPFDVIEHTVTDFGLVLADCLGAIECRKVSSIEPGDHVIIFADVVRCQMIKEKVDPLIYVRKSGLDY